MHRLVLKMHLNFWAYFVSSTSEELYKSIRRKGVHTVTQIMSIKFDNCSFSSFWIESTRLADGPTQTYLCTGTTAGLEYKTLICRKLEREPVKVSYQSGANLDMANLTIYDDIIQIRFRYWKHIRRWSRRQRWRSPRSVWLIRTQIRHIFLMRSPEMMIRRRVSNILWISLWGQLKLARGRGLRPSVPHSSSLFVCEAC